MAVSIFQMVSLGEVGYVRTVEITGTNESESKETLRGGSSMTSLISHRRAWHGLIVTRFLHGKKQIKFFCDVFIT
jgi:hypothetical protein